MLHLYCAADSTAIKSTIILFIVSWHYLQFGLHLLIFSFNNVKLQKPIDL